MLPGVQTNLLHGSTRDFYFIILSYNRGGTLGKIIRTSQLGIYRRSLSEISLPQELVLGFCFIYALKFALTISRQSRSPLSSAVIMTSAVAMLVATGILLRSHTRRSSFSTLASF